MTSGRAAFSAKTFTDGLLEMGFDHFITVPCSYFGPLLIELQQRDGVDYQVASVEAEAVAMAAGVVLGGGTPLVMIQNSGLGNCVNPIASLLDPFGIPVVFLISHRGLVKDAPQHAMMGRVTYPLLELLSVPVTELPDEEVDALEAMKNALDAATQNCCSQALVLSGKPFAAESCEPAVNLDRPSRLEAMRALREAIHEEMLVVASTGMVSRDLHTAGDRAGNFYMVGSMGLASSIALGLAGTTHKTVLVIDGDGSCLMRLGAFPTIGRYAPPNLLHVVLDNGTHSSTGGQATAAGNVDFPALALSCGYRSAATLEGMDQLKNDVASFVKGQGPRLLHVRIKSGNESDPPRVERTLRQIRADFSKACQS